MKFVKFFAVLAVCLLAVSSLYAGGYEFKVMAVKGNVKIYDASSKKWESAKTGSQASKNDKIKIHKNAYASLIHKSGKAVELSKPGTYNASAVSKKVAASKSNVSQRFADYLMDEISSSESLEESDYASQMGTTGAVERSLEKPKPIKLNSPRKVHFMNPVFTFRWKPLKDVKNYKLIISDRFDKPIFEKEARCCSITLNADELDLNRDSYYFWKVRAESDKNKESDYACFLTLSDKKIGAIKDTVDIIKKELKGGNKASSQIILAAFYEQNYLISQAINSYQKALKYAPNVPIYDNLYKRFLNKLQITPK